MPKKKRPRAANDRLFLLNSWPLPAAALAVCAPGFGCGTLSCSRRPGALPARQSPRPSPRLLFARHPARSGSRSVTPSASSSEAGQQGVVAGYVLPVREMKAAIGVLQRVNVELDLCILGDWDNPVVVNVGAFNAPRDDRHEVQHIDVVGTKAGQDHVEAVVSGNGCSLTQAATRTTRQGMSGPPIRRGPSLDRKRARPVPAICEVLAGRAYSSTAPSGWQARNLHHARIRLRSRDETVAVRVRCVLRPRSLACRSAQRVAGRANIRAKGVARGDSGALGVSSDNDAPIVLRLALLPSATA